MADGTKNPENMLASDYPLPMVTEETLISMLADVAELGDDRFIQQAEERLAVNNAVLSRAVKVAAKNGLNGGELFVMLSVHELLRKAAETKTPEHLFNGGYALPHITRETLSSTRGDIVELGNDGFIEASLNKLRVNNPFLYELIDQSSIRPGAKFPIFIMHELLRRQAESDAFDNVFAGTA